MALGLVHVRGRLCIYESKASGNRRAGSKAGKFVRCRPAGKRGYVVDAKAKAAPKRKAAAKRKTTPASGNAHCKTFKVKMFGQGAKKQCRKVCWGTNGKIKSNKPSKGCK